jgi:putative hydrolase of the HAD superfamily
MISPIRALLFDVYGTLLISASGDVEVSEFKEEAVLESFRSGSIDVLHDCSGKNLGRKAIETFKGVIQEKHEQAMARGIPYPEVDILKVWQDVASRLERQGFVRQQPRADYQRCAFVFEVLCNPVYPMPGLKGLLEELKGRGFRMGLVSNAQFFTPLILNFFLSRTITEDQSVPPFDPRLTVFSYKYLRAKPDPYLFELARQQLHLYGIEPRETLYLGNDMLNDVWSASRTGFKTVLFAGDDRSLRLRKDLEQIRSLSPDAVITELNQLLSLLE